MAGALGFQHYGKHLRAFGLQFQGAFGASYGERIAAAHSGWVRKQVDRPDETGLKRLGSFAKSANVLYKRLCRRASGFWATCAKWRATSQTLILPCMKGKIGNDRVLSGEKAREKESKAACSARKVRMREKEKSPKKARFYGLFYGGPIGTLFKPVFTDKKFQATNRPTN